MPKTKISEFSAIPGNNTDIDGINIAEGCPPSGINDAIRELMSQLKDFQAGTAGDSFNGPIGATTPAAGTFTNFSASGTFALTGDQVQISEGGTGQTTANAAFNALAPSQSTHAGKYLKTDGTNTSWDALDISTADITGTLPIANGGTGLTALGTGVQTALGIAVGSAGAFVTNGGALGTPSSGTVTNLTGTASININGTVGATTPTTGAFTTTTISTSETLSYGTANGVAYLNGSKVLTTGSALSFNGSDLTVANGDLTIATNGKKLYVNYIANNSGADLNINGAVNSIFAIASAEQMRLTSTGLGIGTSSPSLKFQVGTRGGMSSDGVFQWGEALTGNNRGFLTWDTGVGIVGAPNNLAFSSGGSTRMTLDASGNLGIGTSSPAYRLDVQAATAVAQVKSTTGTNAAYYVANNTGGDFYIGRENSAGTTFGTTAYSAVLWSAGAYPMAFFTNGIERMRLDSSGNLGIGTSSPGAKLAVSNGTQTGVINPRSSAAGGLAIGTDVASAGHVLNLAGDLNGGGTGGGVNIAYYSSLSTVWNAALSIRNTASTYSNLLLMQDGGNVGIGTSSPSYKLDVSSASTPVARFTGAANAYVDFTDGTVTSRLQNSGALLFGTTSNHSLLLRTNSTTQATLDTSGNFGLGVTPGGWTTYSALELGKNGGGYIGNTASGGFIGIGNNFYFNGSYRYANNAPASFYYQQSGNHYWNNAVGAASGTAFTFTQAMTLASDGTLLLGRTTVPSTAGARVVLNSTGDTAVQLTKEGVVATRVMAVSTGLAFGVDLVDGATERARITSGGEFLIGQTSGGARLNITAATSQNAVNIVLPSDNYLGATIHSTATSGDNQFMAFGTEASFTTRGSISYNRAGGLTAYNTTSDYRAKDIIGPVVNSGATIDALKVYEGKMKGATQARPMMVAHEAQAVVPFCVSGVKDETNEDGTPKYQQMDHASLVPLLIAELQSLRARVAQLEAK